MNQKEFNEINVFLEKHPNPRVMLDKTFDGQIELRLATPINMDDPRPYSDYVEYFLIIVPLRKS